MLEELLEVTGGKPDMPAVGISECVAGVAYKLWVCIFTYWPTHKESQRVTYNVAMTSVQHKILVEGSRSGVYIVI